MSRSPTFDELADAALADMQRQQREQQAEIDSQLRSDTAHGRTIIRKQATNKPSLSSSPTTNIVATPSPQTSSKSLQAVQAVETPMPAAPAEESSNAEMAELNDTNVSLLIEQQKKNAEAQQSLSSILNQQFQSLTQQQQKLGYIQSELHRLDQLLIENISTLRHEIEVVGREVLSLQSEFDIAEKHYLNARVALAKKKQRKLLLTGHLNSIILSNEKEKAKKLLELQVQMGLAPAPPANTGASASANMNTSNGTAASHGNGAAVQPTPPPFQGFDGDAS